MEGYILHGGNIAESVLKKRFERIYSRKALEEFSGLFRDNFITEKDFSNIAKLGANLVRLPFNHKLIEKAPFRYSDEGFAYIEKALCWAERHGLYVILDLHAAPGCQNHDWHSDSSGKADLWNYENYRKRTYALWDYIVSRVAGRKCVIGYDLINEPVILEKGKISVLKTFYAELIRRIRAVDRKRTIYLEGNIWAQQIGFLEDLLDENVSVSFHAYEPLNYTYNFTPFLSYPGKVDGVSWDYKKIRSYLKPYHEFSKRNGITLFLGECGINWRGGHYGETKYLKDFFSVCDEYGFDYTYWTYKAVANSQWPDGIYQYIPNSPYIRRGGLKQGFEAYYDTWRKEKKKIAGFWRTKNYTPNAAIISVLKKHFREN